MRSGDTDGVKVGKDGRDGRGGEGDGGRQRSMSKTSGTRATAGSESELTAPPPPLCLLFSDEAVGIRPRFRMIPIKSYWN
ncbi:hypothetical protein CDL15_Pgr019231 [Punica granatum]|uniref:Uncharacterized protein n=1 Tax=Punica granatum TaxID=22663 RepID=A0A218W616_PUNGR|nr:hypothetical protein CDL15_Pgr019231 [Punica granatum]